MGFFQADARPILHQTIGGLLAIAGAAVISFLAARSYYLTQQPLYKALLLGVAVFLLLALCLLIIGIAVRLLSRKPASTPQQVGVSTQVCSDTWLHEIAEGQRKAIHDWVHVEGCRLGLHDLRRRSAPYIEFGFTIRNSSLFTVSLGSLTGPVYYANEPLNGHVEWVYSVSDLSPGGLNSDCGVRVLLERDAAARLLNINSEFAFNRLKATIKAKPHVDDQVKQFGGRLTNKKLKEVYKGLEIQIDRSELRGRYDFTLKDEQLVAAFVDLHVTCVNPHESQIVIERFKFDANPALRRVASALTGSLQKAPHRYEDIHRHIFPEIIGNNLMDDCPIEAEQGNPIEGWLRFEFRNENPAHLNGTTPTLIAVDSLGVEHRIGCKPLQNEP